MQWITGAEGDKETVKVPCSRREPRWSGRLVVSDGEETGQEGVDINGCSLTDEENGFAQKGAFRDVEP